MGKNTFLRFLNSFLLVLAVKLGCLLPVYAEKVQIEYKGLELVANLEVVPGESLEKKPIIVISHATLLSSQSTVMRDLQQSLLNNGYNSLAITRSLGLNSRVGPFDCRLEQNHRHEDGVDEMRAWLTWLTQSRVEKIILMGFERGASQAGLYIYSQKLFIERETQKRRKRIRNKKKRKKYKFKPRQMPVSNLILFEPLHLSPESVYEKYLEQYRADLGPQLAQAQKYIEEGKGYTLIKGQTFLTCPQAKVTASSFLNYYLPKKEHSIFFLLSNIKQPTLTFIYAGDRDFRRYEDIVSQQLLSRKGKLSVVTLRDRQTIDTDMIAKRVTEFLARE